LKHNDHFEHGMKDKMRKLFSGMVALAALATTVSLVALSISPAHAFQKGEGCGLKVTRDGFVALRKGPRISAKLIHKLKPNFHRVFPDRKNNSWVRVSVGGYGDPDDEGVPMNERDVGEGYVKSSLIDWKTCVIAG
jgi:hypothetical protein